MIGLGISLTTHRRTGSGGGGGFSPASIPSLSRWWKADAGVFQDYDLTIPTINNDDPANYWVDQSVNGVVNGNGNEEGTLLKTAALNGLPAIECSGDIVPFEEDLFAQFDTDTIIGSNTGHIFIVLNQDGSKAVNPAISIYCSDTNRVTLDLSHNDELRLRWGGDGDVISVAQPANWDDNWHLVEAYRDASLGVIRVDGGDVVSDTFAGSFAKCTDGFVVIGSGVFSNDYFKGRIGEILIFKQALVGDDLSNVRAYMQGRWGL